MKEINEEVVSKTIMTVLALSDEAEDFDIKLSHIKRIVALTVRVIQTDNEELLINSIAKWNSIAKTQGGEG